MALVSGRLWRVSRFPLRRTLFSLPTESDRSYLDPGTVLAQRCDLIRRTEQKVQGHWFVAFSLMHLYFRNYPTDTDFRQSRKAP